MTRMGLHVQENRSINWAIDYCREVQPAIMKWLAPERAWIEACKEASPGTKHVARQYWPNQTLDDYGNFRSRVLSRASEFVGLIDWWEGYNEVATHDAYFLRQFCQREVDLARRLNDIGVGAALGGFSTGAFDEAGAAYDAVRPMLEFLHVTGPNNVWHSHEYAGPYMQYMVRTPDGLNQWPKPPDAFNGASADGIWEPTVDGWLTLRYRMLRKLLVRDGLANVHMIFTETGIDDVNPRPGGANRKGWRDYDGTEWSRLPGIGDYADQQRWYAWQLSHDAYVVGYVDYGFGTVDPAWNSFDLSQTPDMLRRVKDEQRRLPVGKVGAVEPVPVPNPDPPVIKPEEPMTTIAGVDVSRWQGTMDWRACKAAGNVFAWIKASEGTTWTDTKYAENVRGAAAAGIAWGPYHYYINAYDPVEQAKQFARTVLNNSTTNWALPPAIDLEDTKTALNVERLETFVGLVAEYLGTPIIYTANWWVAQQDHIRWLGNFPLWVAHYGVSLPKVPEPWSDWTVWQWASRGTGPAHGAQSEYIDRNVYRGALTDLMALKTNAPTEPPIEPDVETIKAAARSEHLAHGIQYNPDAALAKVIESHSLWPTTGEFDVAGVVAQRAENRAGARVYFWDPKTGTTDFAEL